MSASQTTVAVRRHSTSSHSKRNATVAKTKTFSENGSTSTRGGRKSFSSSLSRLPSTGERTVKRLRLTKALTIPEGTTVLDACRRMTTRRVDAALLTDSAALLCGIITDKDVATRVIAEGLKPEETTVSKVMTRNPHFVMSETPAVDALQKMVQGKFRHLPVVENNEVIALLDITKCLYDAIAQMEMVAEKGDAIAAAVQDVEQQWGNTLTAPLNFVDILREKMFRPTLGSLIQEGSKVATVSPSDSVSVAAKKMQEFRTSSVIVTRSNKPQGILTSNDILTRVIAQNLSPDFTHADKVMTANPDCATIDTTIVDALHIMHDGKFLHLPVIDQDGCIVACLDVLQLTHAAMATVGSAEGSSDTTSIMLQKFWDSALAFEPAEDDYESRSQFSLTKSAANTHTSDHLKYPTLGLGSQFSFKFEDLQGRVHRFTSGSESLTELLSAVAQRVGNDMDTSKLSHLLYEDDEGDHIVLATDNDLVAAINQAKLSGWKCIKLHLEPSLSTRESIKVKSGEGDLDMHMKKQHNWGSSVYTAAVMGTAAIAGVTMLMFFKRPSI
ncbi:hypothetical protein KP509_07G021100 [Ceratopteris richardii]|uniref:Uncharacterized protein n=1 Tax=Ceratopteris richardii TaxID=49495 RepID=A0A8T2UCK7_CERRI|nr:hypothetical protein KP509_07G021100 [Ceratopteris richardii]KAH7432407.1 hypothetical protein KP509_07G021100 [Ceratopteris richardii]KAH7432408.1 hypothetical protein KP509_07G021100 [Ceratopteris richardii]